MTSINRHCIVIQRKQYNQAVNTDITHLLKTFFIKHTFHQYKKGDVCIRGGETPSGVFYLTDGYVKMYSLSTKGVQVTLTVFKPGSFFPMHWAMHETKNRYFFEALTDIDVWVAPRKQVLSFIKKHPDVLYDLLSRVFRGLDGVMERMSYTVSDTAAHRLVFELLIAAKRFGQTSADKTISLHVTEKDIAHQTGLTPETISREMKKLKQKGFVHISKTGITIQQIHPLEKMLDLPY